MADWLLKGEPRAVQIEALLRSYDGYTQRDNQDDESKLLVPMFSHKGDPRDGPARGWAHFMEQRLGKTPVSLNEFALYRRDYGFKWNLIFSPFSYKPEWVSEAERWGLDVPYHEFNSSNRKAAQRFINNNRNFGGGIVFGHTTLIQPDTRDLIQQLLGPEAMIVWDESINIKNPQASTTKYAIQMAKECGARRVLTGKPVTEGPNNYWAQLRFIGELSGFNYHAFRNHFCKMGGFEQRQVKDSLNEDELQQMLSHMAFIARRIDWMHTPGREYAPRRFEMLLEQKVHYKRMSDDLMAYIAEFYGYAEGVDEEVVAVDQIITKMQKLMQISSGFIYDEGGKPHDIMPLSKNPKMQEVKDMLENEITSKTILIAHHTHTIDMLMEILAPLKPALIAGTGQMKQYDRDVQSEKARFNGDRSCRVAVGQTKAIKYGHTLVGMPDDPCLNQIYVENTYSLDDRSQTEERAQGAGQQGLLTIWDMECSPQEGAAIQALVNKEDISAAVIGYARSTGLLPALSRSLAAQRAAAGG